MRVALLLLMGMAGAWGLIAEESVLVRHPTRLRLSGEIVDLAVGERMGLAGIGYDALAPCPWLPGAWVGIAGYGAAGGDRGGLFTLGVSGGWRTRVVGVLGIEVGGYAGGGGGASAGQGDGLHLRGHGLLTLALPCGELAAGVVANHFRGGTIDDTGWTVGWHCHDDLTVLGRGDGRPATVDTRTWTVGPLIGTYRSEGEIGRSGAELGAIDLVGFTIERHLDAGFRLPLRLAGAWRGATGYMEVLGGVGWVGPWRIAPEATVLFGAGGGGDVDTGGGLLVRPELGIGVRLLDALALRVSGGWTWALDGDFAAPGATVALGWTSQAWSIIDGDRGSLAASAVQRDPWRIVIGGTRYEPVEGRDDGLSLVSVLVEKPVTGMLVLTGRARSALSDQAGGYSEGLLGARLDFRIFPRHTIAVGGELGAAGGGGIPTGSGAIGSLTGHWRWMWSDAWGVQIGGGRLEALDGPFVTDLIEVGLVWSFARPLVARKAAR